MAGTRLALLEGVNQEDIVTKTTPISRVVELLQTKPDVMHLGDSIYSLALQIAWDPVTRVVCVVDSEGRLVGLVPLRVILQNIFYEAGEAGLYSTRREAGGLPEAPGAETARDLMEAPEWVLLGDSVKDAVDKMLAARLDGLPVVDGEMRVIGFVDMAELLRLWLGSARRPRGVRAQNSPTAPA